MAKKFLQSRKYQRGPTKAKEFGVLGEVAEQVGP